MIDAGPPGRPGKIRSPMRAHQWFAVALPLICAPGRWLAAPSSDRAGGGLMVLNEVAASFRIASRVPWAGNLVGQEVKMNDAARKQPSTTAAVAREPRLGAAAIHAPFAGRVTTGDVDVRYPPLEPSGELGQRWIGIRTVNPDAVEHHYWAPGQAWAVGSGGSGVAVTMSIGPGLIALPMVVRRFWPQPAPLPPEPEASRVTC